MLAPFGMEALAGGSKLRFVFANFLSHQGCRRVDGVGGVYRVASELHRFSADDVAGVQAGVLGLAEVLGADAVGDVQGGGGLRRA